MTSYDEVAYPSAIFSQATPDRLALMSRLHGIDSPPIETARVLEIGGGESDNLLAVGVAYPGIQGLSFDLAGAAVARGRALAADAGIANVAIEQIDILDAAGGAIEGQWDYVIAHGVYAWVPEPVRVATMALIGRALRPKGVAYVSYNAKPGGHLRVAMREMLLEELAGIEGAVERLRAAKAFLTEFAARAPNEEPIAVAMRKLAAAMAARPDAVLHHDELGEVYAPQSVSEVAEAAAGEGLVWLGDAGIGRLADGFLGETDAEVLRTAQRADYSEGRFFRQSLFVRAEAKPKRSLSIAALGDLFAACRGRRQDEDTYVVGEGRFQVGDTLLREGLDRLISRWPGRLRCRDLFESPQHLAALFRLFDGGLVDLHAADAPFVLEAGPRPLASPLVRTQLARGWPAIATLDHGTVAIEDERVRAFLMLLDGSRDRTELARRWEEMGHAADVPLEAALASAAAGATLLA